MAILADSEFPLMTSHQSGDAAIGSNKEIVQCPNFLLMPVDSETGTLKGN